MSRHLDPETLACPHCHCRIVIEVTADLPFECSPGRWQIDVHAGRTEHHCPDGTVYVAGDHDAIRQAAN